MGRWVRQVGFLFVRKHGTILGYTTSTPCIVCTCTDAHAGWTRSRTSYDPFWKGAAMHQVITTAHYLDL